MDDETAPPTSGSGEPGTPANKTAEPREPPTLETALTWIAKVQPAAALALLREPEFALISVSAFAGFRVNATGYRNPLVRRRLAQEAVREEKFAEKLRALAEAAAPTLSPRPSLPTKAITRNETTREDALRADRDRRRRERDEARYAQAEAEAARGEAESARQYAEAERDNATRLVQRQTQRIERQERQIAKLHAEQAGLLRALRHHSPASPPAATHGGIARKESSSAHSRSGPEETSSAGQFPPWQTAVVHLLDKRKYDIALGLAEDVLRKNPDEPEALDIAARAHEGRDDSHLAVPLLRRLLAARLSHGGIPEAGETLLRLLRLAAPHETERDVRAFLAALKPGDTSAVERTRTILVRLRGSSPDAFEALAARIRSLAAPALAEALLPIPGLPGPDDLLPLPLSPPLTARRLVGAIDAGDMEIVSRARAALSHLCEHDPATQARVKQALERAAEADDTYLRTLFGRQRGPVIVDGSNAAWFDQDSLAAGRPRLRPLLGLRRALRGQGYFPILLYADAPLPYTIDEPERLWEMAARAEITMVDGGVDADEVLLRAAKHWNAPLVTNDHMHDWDPLGEVTKIRYTIAANGGALLLSH